MVSKGENMVCSPFFGRREHATGLLLGCRNIKTFFRLKVRTVLLTQLNADNPITEGRIERNEAGAHSKFSSPKVMARVSFKSCQRMRRQNMALRGPEQTCQKPQVHRWQN